jgi:hypothetical protein
VRNPPINNLDLSLSKNFAVVKSVKFEFRVDMFNALNHTQFTGVNSTVNFASLTDRTITNLPFDASGKLVNQNGFGTINGVAPPRTLQLMTRVTFKVALFDQPKKVTRGRRALNLCVFILAVLLRLCERVEERLEFSSKRGCLFRALARAISPAKSARSRHKPSSSVSDSLARARE